MLAGMDPAVAAAFAEGVDNGNASALFTTPTAKERRAARREAGIRRYDNTLVVAKIRAKQAIVFELMRNAQFNALSMGETPVDALNAARASFVVQLELRPTPPSALALRVTDVLKSAIHTTPGVSSRFADIVCRELYTAQTYIRKPNLAKQTVRDLDYRGLVYTFAVFAWAWTAAAKHSTRLTHRMLFRESIRILLGDGMCVFSDQLMLLRNGEAHTGDILNTLALHTTSIEAHQGHMAHAKSSLRNRVPLPLSALLVFDSSAAPIEGDDDGPADADAMQNTAHAFVFAATVGQ